MYIHFFRDNFSECARIVCKGTCSALESVFRRWTGRCSPNLVQDWARRKFKTYWAFATENLPRVNGTTTSKLVPNYGNIRWRYTVYPGDTLWCILALDSSSSRSISSWWLLGGLKRDPAQPTGENGENGVPTVSPTAYTTHGTRFKWIRASFLFETTFIQLEMAVKGDNSGPLWHTRLTSAQNLIGIWICSKALQKWDGSLRVLGCFLVDAGYFKMRRCCYFFLRF